jgi:hypothetical protein
MVVGVRGFSEWGGVVIFVGRSEEQDRFRQVLQEVRAKPGGGPDEGYVVLVRGYGGIGKSTLLRRFAEITRGTIPDLAVGKFIDFGVDWEQDRELHSEDYVEFAGPPIWRILDRLRASLENTARSWGWWHRRWLQGFTDFQRQITKLPELEERAAELGLTKQLGHKPVSSEQIMKATKAAGQVAEAAGVASAVVSPIGPAVDLMVEVGSAVWRARPARFDPAAYRALVDQVDGLVEAFTVGLRRLAKKRPVVVFLDTCELLGGSGPWLREAMRRSGPRVLWVIGTRLEPGELAAAESEARSYEREMDERRLRMITLTRFDDRTAAHYLEQRLGQVPSSLNVDRVIELTQGVPLALHFMAGLIDVRMKHGEAFDGLYEEIGGDGTVSSVVAEMARRYLVHATQEQDSELSRDLPLLYGLALINVDQGVSSRVSPPNPFDYRLPFEDPAEAPPVAVGRDPALLAALWGVPPGRVAELLRHLSRRHDFVHSGGGGTLHRDVRDAIRLFLLTPVNRVSDDVKPINERAVEHLRARIADREHHTVEDRLMDADWRTASAALIWHTFWLEPSEGIKQLCRVFVPAAVLQRSYARLLVETADLFRPYCTDDQQI